MMNKAPHFGTPLRRIQASAGVATIAMKMASRIGDSSGAAVFNKVTTSAIAPATTRPRAGALKVDSTFMGTILPQLG